ncbi:M48 family metallopeptidase [Palleronia sp. KMU-117]|uniref:M48 family metallopeptidase n=1 Tax=Palleronia sp. KMU-117 TaxID=3434108 RepID=UPI003D70B0C2
MTGVFADFVDGRTARVQRAEVSLSGEWLAIALPEAPPRQWRLDDLFSPNDQAGDRGLVVSSTDEPLARLYLADADMVRVLRSQAPHLTRRSPARAGAGGTGRIFAWGAAAVASVALILFVMLPVLANQLATLLPARGEKALGDATLAQVRSALAEGAVDGLRVCDAPEGVAALERMRARIVGDRTLPYDLTLTVLDHELVNAFALPGGHIVFFRGLIDAAGDPDEVAAVFAHELGHVVSRDPVRIALRSAGSIGVLGLLFGDFAGGAVVLFLTERLIQASYTREAEAAADAFALAAMAEAGIRPDALATFFEALQKDVGAVPGILRHFLSHPDLGDRIVASRNAGATSGRAFTPALDAADWAALGRICE